MGKRRSIYVGEALQTLLDEHNATDDNAIRGVSATINAVADRYREIVARSRPDLTEQEWYLLFDVLNGYWTCDNAALYVRGLRHSVADAIALDGFDEKWSVDGKALLSKLDKMGFHELVAIIDAGERFWANCPTRPSTKTSNHEGGLQCV